MFSPFSWFFKKLARRYDGNTLHILPDDDAVWKKICPPWWERALRWLFGSPFTEAGTPEAVFFRWAQRVLLVALYLLFLWWLYESFWAWDIFA